MKDMTPETQSQLDQALQEQFPLHAVGVYTPFVPLKDVGVRCLMTAFGLMLEACNGVHYFRDYLTRKVTPIKLPYGELAPATGVVDVQAQAQVTQLLSQARQDAHDSYHTEIVRLIVKAPGRPVRYLNPVITATAGSATYNMTQIDSDEQVIIDLHSHATMDSFFSGRDNEDDAIFRGNLKLSVVLGHCDKVPEQMSVLARYVTRGIIFDEHRVISAC